MKRFITTICLSATAVMAFSQAPFTIVRPADGSRVREVVHVLIPKSSVPPGGYIGIYAQGKFIEATILPTDSSGKFYVYNLDTQARHLADGPLTIEAVLFENYEDTPRIINRTSVNLTLQNSAASFLPADGILMRYSWPVNTQYMYKIYKRVITEEGTNAESSLGGRPTSQSADFQSFRYLYEVDDHYSNGDGLVRQQLMPLKGQDRLFMIVNNMTEPTYHDQSEIHALYLRLTNTGLQRWGAVPVAVQMKGTSIASSMVDLYGLELLPSLPFQRVQEGSSWAARYQQSSLKLNDLYGNDSIVSHFPMRGEVKGVEWVMGHPCVHVQNTISIGEMSDEAKKALNKQDQNGDSNENDEEGTNKISLTQDYWYAIDKHAVLKVHSVVTREQKANFQNNFGGGAPAGGRAGGPSAAGTAGGPSSKGNGGGNGSAMGTGPINDFQLKGGGKGLPGVPQGPGGPGGFGGFGRPGGESGGASTTSQGFVRVKVITTMILSQ